jgi:hypothetical protein
VPVAHTCNPSYSGSRDEKDGGLKSAQGNSSWDPISKIPSTKQNRAGTVAQVVEHLPTKCKALSSNPTPTKKKKKRLIKNLNLQSITLTLLSLNEQLKHNHFFYSDRDNPRPAPRLSVLVVNNKCRKSCLFVFVPHITRLCTRNT